MTTSQNRSAHIFVLFDSKVTSCDIQKRDVSTELSLAWNRIINLHFAGKNNVFVR